MVRTAVLYGIYGNFPALQAVVGDARSLGVDRFVCMGDSISIGPDPVACLQWVVGNCAWHMPGFRERCLADSDYMKLRASTLYQNETVTWSRERVLETESGEELIRQVNSGAHKVQEQDTLYVYGSVRQPADGWLTVGQGGNWQALEYPALPSDTKLCVGGRQYQPCICWPDGSEELPQHAARHPRKILPQQLIVVGGAVGAGKFSDDTDPSAKYVVLDDEGIEFRRVAYDYQKVAAEVKGITALSAECRQQMVSRISHGKIQRI